MMTGTGERTSRALHEVSRQDDRNSQSQKEIIAKYYRRLDGGLKVAIRSLVQRALDVWWNFAAKLLEILVRLILISV